MKPPKPPKLPPLVIAHRGASSIALENSLAAFRAASGQGADGVELDVHATLDGEIVVHHDPSVLGLPIAQARWRDLAAVPLANGEPIPTLAQALDALGTLKVFVEVKVLDPRWDDRLLATLGSGPNPSGYAVHSFAFHVVRRLGEKRPSLPRGVLSEVPTKNPRQTLADASAQTLWQERTTLDEALVQTVHGLGASVIVWTVDNPSDMERLVRWRVDGICTNHPERARPIVDASRAA
ncbi:MAG TPA: glycerophosphodiester phosphodiesterase [Gemmatimonadales bacterium]|nr:glycerophosphodiester phosphodiesterase [Gemmatimonadales bacterium]